MSDLTKQPTALIADDEPLLREALCQQLKQVWPELRIIAQARNGREAIAFFQQFTPDICFLDVHMPGISGVEAARQIGQQAHLVFVTAYDQYALQAFEHGVLDYLVKPVEKSRLTATVARLQQRLLSAQPAMNTDSLLHQLAGQLQGLAKPAPLRWLKAQVGKTLRLISVDDIAYFRADHKYTLVVWKNDENEPAEALIRTSLKELMKQLDDSQFTQVHRSVLVNLRAISHIKYGENETAQIFLKHSDNVLPVSRSYLHLFKQM